MTWGQVGIYVGLSAMIKLEIHSNAAFSECASQTYHFLLTEFPGVDGDDDIGYGHVVKW